MWLTCHSIPLPDALNSKMMNECVLMPADLTTTVYQQKKKERYTIRVWSVFFPLFSQWPVGGEMDYLISREGHWRVAFCYLICSHNHEGINSECLRQHVIYSLSHTCTHAGWLWASEVIPYTCTATMHELPFNRRILSHLSGYTSSDGKTL